MSVVPIVGPRRGGPPWRGAAAVGHPPERIAVSVRNDQGTGRPDTKMSRWNDATEPSPNRARSVAHRRVQRKANKKRRQRDRTAAAASRFDDPADRDSAEEATR